MLRFLYIKLKYNINVLSNLVLEVVYCIAPFIFENKVQVLTNPELENKVYVPSNMELETVNCVAILHFYIK